MSIDLPTKQVTTQRDADRGDVNDRELALEEHADVNYNSAFFYVIAGDDPRNADGGNEAATLPDRF